MSTLYLHIGTPKTGTSAIQKFLTINRTVLEQQNCCYPDWGFRYKKASDNRNGYFLAHLNDGETEEEKAAIEAEIKANEQTVIDSLGDLSAKYGTIILSEESIWPKHAPKTEFWEKWKSIFNAHNIDVKVIVYLRRQDLFVQSYWAQRVKTKEKRDFKRYISAKGYKYIPLNYYEVLEQIASVIGKDNMIVRVYEKSQYEGVAHNLISDFMKMVGLELTEDFRNPDLIFNTSLAAESIEVKRILNSMDGFSDKKNYVTDYLKLAQAEVEQEREPQKASFFTMEDQVAFLGQFASSNEAVAREYLGREDGVLFNEPVEEMPTYEFSKEDLIRICGRVIIKQREDYEACLKERDHYKEKVQQLKGIISEQKKLENETEQNLKKTKSKSMDNIFSSMMKKD